MIPYKVFFPAMGVVSSFALSVVFLLVKAPVSWAVVITIAVAVLVISVSSRLVHVADVFANWAQDSKDIAVRLIGAAILANGAFAVVTEIGGSHVIPLVILCLIILGGVESFVSKIAESYLAKFRPRMIKAKADRVKEIQRIKGTNGAVEVLKGHQKETDEDVPHDIKVMKKALKRAGLGWLVIKKSDALCDDQGEAFGRRFDVQITAEAMKTKKRSSLGTENCEPVAIALSEVTGIDLESRWVGIQKLKRAGGYSVTVTTQDVMSRVYPYVDEPKWRSIHEPAIAGYGLDAKPIGLRLDQHGQYIGQTRSGKTSLINSLLAYMLECEDAVVWICGTEKLYDMLAGWLEVYLDTDEEMPFDWIMSGPQDTVNMMAGIMRGARYRQTLRLDQRKGLPDVICILDEASFALRNNNVTAIYDDRELTMSQFGGMIGQGTGSAGFWLQYATQRDTNDQLGTAGGDLQAQTGFTCAFGTQDGLSLGRQLGDFKLPPPVHKGEYYLKASGEPYPQLLKSRYIQESDPSKPKIHDGVTLKDVSWSRRKFKTHLDEGTAQAIGEIYLNRPRYVTDKFLDYLSSPGVGAPVDRSGTSSTSSITVLEKAPVAGELTKPDPDAMAKQLASDMGEDFATLPLGKKKAYRTVAATLIADGLMDSAEEEVVIPPPPVESPANQGGTRVDRILDVLRQADKPQSSTDIVNLLRDQGDKVPNEGAVYNALGRMVKDGSITKDEDRLFSLAQ